MQALAALASASPSSKDTPETGLAKATRASIERELDSGDKDLDESDELDFGLFDDVDEVHEWDSNFGLDDVNAGPAETDVPEAFGTGQKIPAPFGAPTSLDLWLAGSERPLEVALRTLLPQEQCVAPSRAPLAVLSSSREGIYTCDFEGIKGSAPVRPSNLPLAEALNRMAEDKIVVVTTRNRILPLDRLIVCLPPCAPLTVDALVPWWQGRDEIPLRRVVWFAPYHGAPCKGDDRDFFLRYLSHIPLHYVLIGLSRAPVCAASTDCGDPMESTLKQFTDAFAGDFKPWMHICE